MWNRLFPLFLSASIVGTAWSDDAVLDPGTGVLSLPGVELGSGGAVYDNVAVRFLLDHTWTLAAYDTQPRSGGVMPDDAQFDPGSGVLFVPTARLGAGGPLFRNVRVRLKGDGTWHLLSFQPGDTTGASHSVSVLHAFSDTDGRLPVSRLVQGGDGSLYGTTEWGGDDDCGTVFRVTPGGQFGTLHHLIGAQDGCLPKAGLTWGGDGNLYGVANYGGSKDGGTIFRVTPGGAFTTVHHFGIIDSPNYPTARLVLGRDGHLYGTTSDGGEGDSGDGTVFRFSSGGVFTVLHTFTGLTESGEASPVEPLVQAADGNFYGTTDRGGAAFEGVDHSSGAVFRITPAGDYTLLHEFSGPDGRSPGPLVEGPDGNLYGTASSGGSTACGAFTGCGTAFRISTGGDFAILHEFGASGSNETTTPTGGLTLADDGYFYGTSTVVWRMTATGEVTPLYSVAQTQLEGPSTPYAGVIQGADGDLYATSMGGGGMQSMGTVFKVDLGP